MLYQLPGGGTIKVNEELFFRLSDAEWEKYIMYVKAGEINDPWHESALDSPLIDDEVIQAMKEDVPDIQPDLSDFMPEE